VGSLFSAVSALGYTAANICLRDVALECDPSWVSCIKAVPASIAAWLLIARRASQGLPAMPTARLLPILIVTGLFMQIGGNVGFQWSLGIIGLAMSVPMVFGTLLLSSAAASRIWLGEAITRRCAVAMLMLILAVAALSWGSKETTVLSDSAWKIGNSQLVALALGAAALAGVSYAACNIAIRRLAGNVIPLSATLMVFSTTGVVSLGLLSYWQIGWTGMLNTTAGQWSSMLQAGLYNAIAFFSLGLALQAISVARTNLINASQVAMSVVAGIIIFGEQLSNPVIWGVALTVAGLAIMDRRT